MTWAAQFSVDKAIDSYLTIYRAVLSLTLGGRGAASPVDERAKA